MGIFLYYLRREVGFYDHFPRNFLWKSYQRCCSCVTVTVVLQYCILEQSQATRLSTSVSLWMLQCHCAEINEVFFRKAKEKNKHFLKKWPQPVQIECCRCQTVFTCSGSSGIIQKPQVVQMSCQGRFQSTCFVTSTRFLCFTALTYNAHFLLAELLSGNFDLPIATYLLNYKKRTVIHHLYRY